MPPKAVKEKAVKGDEGECRARIRSSTNPTTDHHVTLLVFLHRDSLLPILHKSRLVVRAS
jgi:hypothetical protein